MNKRKQTKAEMNIDENNACDCHLIQFYSNSIQCYMLGSACDRLHATSVYPQKVSYQLCNSKCDFHDRFSKPQFYT